jgi:hypothetical protein
MRGGFCGEPEGSARFWLGCKYWPVAVSILFFFSEAASGSSFLSLEKRTGMTRRIKKVPTALSRCASDEALDSLGGTEGGWCGTPNVEEEPNVDIDPFFILGLGLPLSLLAIEKLEWWRPKTVFRIPRRELVDGKPGVGLLHCMSASAVADDNGDDSTDLVPSGVAAFLHVWKE